MILNRIKRKSNADAARDLGVKIGKDSQILANPYRCFGSEPYLIELGEHVEVTSGCRFITHDGAVWTLRKFPETENLDKFGKIVVGNNVFIGVNSIIMPNVKIGDNCIIGAGALVTKSIPSGEVWGGVPAKFICTFEDYRQKAIKTADYTHSLSSQEKKKALMKNHPDWF